MRIGIISDTHDDLDNVTVALYHLASVGVDTVLHCGDVCGPDVVRVLAGFDVWVAQGNMDQNRGLAQAVGETLGQGRLAWFHRLTLTGYPLALIHGDNEEVLNNLISSGQYSYLLHGHTHQRRDVMVGRTRVINPGALGGDRGQLYSFCILDLGADEVRFVEL